MQVITSYLDMQKFSRDLKSHGKRRGFVPTMGFLHEGHLRLVDEAKGNSDVVVLSIFVNPTQFGPGEDFEQYPRDMDRDQKLAEERGVDVVFLPTVQEVYPPGDQTTVVVTELTRGLCGPFRPGHFRGVTTVVAKLFSMVQPDVAFFGEKDYQQLMVIKQMVHDLRLPIEVIGIPTVREESGLAMSSRNTYLDPEEREEALNLFRALTKAQELVGQGERDVKKIDALVHRQLQSGTHTTLDYAEIVDAENLQGLESLDRPARLVMAIRVNGKRLIDNGPLEPSS